MKSLRICLLSILFALSTSCTSSGRWHEVDRFAEGLRCGMSPTDVAAYARGYEGARAYVPGPSNLPPLRVERGVTTVDLWFSEGGLESFQVKWISEPMKLTTEPKKNLCKK